MVNSAMPALPLSLNTSGTNGRLTGCPKGDSRGFVGRLFESARRTLRRIVYAEGEEPRVLRAVQTVVDERLALPILLGRRQVIQERAKQQGVRLDFEKDVTILDPDLDEVTFAHLRDHYQTLVERRGVTPDAADRGILSRRAIAAALLLAVGEADAALCGGVGDWLRQFKQIQPIIPRQEGISRIYSLSSLILPNGALFFCDTHINLEPSAEQIAEMTVLLGGKIQFAVVC